MQGHFGRCAGILELDLADVEQELGQLEGALGQRRACFSVAGSS